MTDPRGAPRRWAQQPESAESSGTPWYSWLTRRAEAASFGALLQRLDVAVRAVTGAERVHLVSTRDRVQHFHAWLYPRAFDAPLRGTDYLAAPQSCTVQEAIDASDRLRRVLAEVASEPVPRPRGG